MANQTLIQIAQDNAALWQLLDEANGEVDSILESFQQEISTNLSGKVDKYKHVIDNFDTQAEIARNKSKMFAAAAQSLEKLSDGVKQRIKDAMQIMGKDEITGQDFRFKLSNTAGSLKLNEELIPDSYMIVETITRPDKERIKKEVQAGKEIPGAEIVQGKSLRVYIAKGEK